jgi:hypothetical protein
MYTTYLNEAAARQRTADLSRRARRAQRPVVDSPAPRRGIVLAFGWLTRPSQVLPGSPA